MMEWSDTNREIYEEIASSLAGMQLPQFNCSENQVYMALQKQTVSWETWLQQLIKRVKELNENIIITPTDHGKYPFGGNDSFFNLRQGDKEALISIGSCIPPVTFHKSPE